MAEVLRGVVKWFNNAKGFGFIEHETGKDVFVHYSVIESEGYKSLKDGEVVEYELKEGPKGFHASKVQRLNAKSVDDESQGLSVTDSNGDTGDEDEQTGHEMPGLLGRMTN